MKCLIVEFGGNHTETIGFYLQGFSELGYKITIYYDSENINSSYIPLYKRYFEFDLITDPYALHEETQSTMYDFVVFNSARNLRRGSSRGCLFFNHLTACGYNHQKILIQAHNQQDLSLPFVSSYKSIKISPTPLFRTSNQITLIPLFEIGDPNLQKGEREIDMSDISFIKIGGVYKHSENEIDLKSLTSIAKRCGSVTFYGMKDQCEIENIEVKECLTNNNVTYVQGCGADEIAREHSHRPSFLWAKHSQESIYNTRIFSGSLAFSINFNIPLVTDFTTASTYGMFIKQLICHFSIFNDDIETGFLERLSLDYEKIIYEWECYRKSMILQQQYCLKGLVHCLVDAHK